MACNASSVLDDVLFEQFKSDEHTSSFPTTKSVPQTKCPFALQNQGHIQLDYGGKSDMMSSLDHAIEHAGIASSSACLGDYSTDGPSACLGSYASHREACSSPRQQTAYRESFKPSEEQKTVAPATVPKTMDADGIYCDRASVIQAGSLPRSAMAPIRDSVSFVTYENVRDANVVDTASMQEPAEDHKVHLTEISTTQRTKDYCLPDNTELVKAVKELSSTVSTSLNTLFVSIDRLTERLGTLETRITPTTQLNEQLNTPSYSVNEMPSTFLGQPHAGQPSYNGSSRTPSQPTSTPPQPPAPQPSAHLSNPFSYIDPGFPGTPQKDPQHQWMEESRRAASEKKYILEEQRRRSQLDKRARELMNTISLIKDDSKPSLFSDPAYPSPAPPTNGIYTEKPRGNVLNPLFE